MEQGAERLTNECRRIEADSTYNAECHHLIAASTKKLGQRLKFVIAGCSAISGVLILAGVASWVAWFSVLSGLAMALIAVLDVDRKNFDHSGAAKEFTVLKHEARSLHETFALEMNRQEFSMAVRRLRDKYNDLVLHTPQTSDEAFREAQERIKSGLHSPDLAVSDEARTKAASESQRVID